jgi:hypothetical protein
MSDNAEIQQQAEPQAGCFEIIGALHPVRAIQRFDGLQFNQQHVLHQQVREVFANQHVFAEHPYAVPLHNREARGTQRMSIHSHRPHHESGAKRAEHSKRTTDHLPR